MSDVSFKTAKKRRGPVTFDLEGDSHEYTFKPPKTAAMVLPMLDAEDDLEAAKAAFAWLDKGMSEEDRAHLTARLYNEDDDLDIEDLEDVVAGLVEKVSGRPTT